MIRHILEYRRRLSLPLVVFAIMLVNGCALKASSGEQGFDVVTFSLNKRSNENYSLRGWKSGKIASDDGSDGKLTFRFPRDVRDECFSVVNSQGFLFSGLNGFALDLRKDYRSAVVKLRELKRSIADLEAAQRNSRRLGLRSENNLNANPAFNGRSCQLPPRGALPARPKTICRSRQECDSEGAAICYTIFFGSEGCGLAAKNEGVPSLFSSAACSKAVHELAGRKYGLSEALKDSIYGAIEDSASSLLDSESVFEQFLGGLALVASKAVKLSSAATCHRDFVESHYDSPINAWKRQVQNIKDGPNRAKTACINSIKTYNRSIRDGKKYVDQIGKLIQQTKRHEHALEVLRTTTRPVKACSVPVGNRRL